ncbi:SpoIIE family protein phosphatase [Crenothrix sp.]|uniref:SpoIIE family protein phosphatase n=1 Tax=Crenothrix sp. TaxID=3100433 RepID=UPI00374DC1F4
MAMTKKLPNRCQDFETALIDSEQRFRQMADIAGEWLWEQDPQGYYTYSSIAVKKILGFTPEEVIGKHYTTFLTPQDKANQKDYTTEKTAFYNLINNYRHQDGRPVLTESTGLPIFAPTGQLLKWRGIDRDITSKKQFEDALLDSEKRLRLVIESALSAIVMMDSYGIITDWNRQAENMFGWSNKEAIGQRLDSLIIPSRFHSAHRQGLQQFLQTGHGEILNRRIEHIAKRRDGSEFPVELSIAPLKLGNTYIFSGFVNDITARKAAEQHTREVQISLAIAQSEINMARHIQSSLLPSAPIITKDFQIAGYCLPANLVGGDYFDYFFRTDTQLDMVIADVSGHSFAPALFMVAARSAIRTYANSTQSPAHIIDTLNRFMFKDLDNSDFFITLFYLQYDIVRHELRFANAGHPPPLLLSAGQSQCQRLDADGLILGVREQVTFEEKTVLMAKNDVLLIYTDGLTEAENAEGEFFGLERVSDIFSQHCGQTPQAIIDALLSELKQFCQRDALKDDITLMVFKRN